MFSVALASTDLTSSDVVSGTVAPVAKRFAAPGVDGLAAATAASAVVLFFFVFFGCS